MILWLSFGTFQPTLSEMMPRDNLGSGNWSELRKLLSMGMLRPWMNNPFGLNCKYSKLSFVTAKHSHTETTAQAHTHTHALTHAQRPKHKHADTSHWQTECTTIHSCCNNHGRKKMARRGLVLVEWTPSKLLREGASAPFKDWVFPASKEGRRKKKKGKKREREKSFLALTSELQLLRQRQK